MGLNYWQIRNLVEFERALETESKYAFERFLFELELRGVIDNGECLPPIEKLPGWTKKARAKIDAYKTVHFYLKEIKKGFRDDKNTLKELYKYIKELIPKVKDKYASQNEISYRDGIIEAVNEIRREIRKIKKIEG